MPQFDATTFPSQIIWLIVAIVVLHLVLSRFALPRVAEIVATREQAINGDLERARELHEQAEALREGIAKRNEEAQREAQRVAAEGRAETRRLIELERAESEAQIAAAAERAEARIRDVRDAALADIDVVARETAGAIADRFLLERSDRATTDAAVAARLRLH